MFISEKMQCCNVDEIFVWSSPRPSAAARHTAHQHFVYLPSQERCKQDNNIHILLQSTERLKAAHSMSRIHLLYKSSLFSVLLQVSQATLCFK